jgi:hypothetical protein
MTIKNNFDRDWCIEKIQMYLIQEYEFNEFPCDPSYEARTLTRREISILKQKTHEMLSSYSDTELDFACDYYCYDEIFYENERVSPPESKSSLGLSEDFRSLRRLIDLAFEDDEEKIKSEIAFHKKYYSDFAYDSKEREVVIKKLTKYFFNEAKSIFHGIPVQQLNNTIIRNLKKCSDTSLDIQLMINLKNQPAEFFRSLPLLEAYPYYRESHEEIDYSNLRPL